METKISKIAVAARIRPILTQEIKNGLMNSLLEVDKPASSIILSAQDQKLNKRFKFDYLLEETSEQHEVYSNLKIDEMLDKVIQGFNSTIFAYGQTGSGKTFTLEGYNYDLKMRPIITSDDRIGIIPRLITSLFSKIKSADKSVDYTVYVTFVQLYRETISDLLNPAQRNGGLKMRWNKQDEFYVENLYSYPCYDADELISHYHRGLKNKVMASHNLNASSSRSHCVFCITLEALDKTGRILRSKFQVVDLAGSERTSQTGNEGLMLKESIEINKALFTLRQVITCLSQGETHVPYRDSKLTSLLKQSIGGNSYCLMIACVSPIDDYIEENFSTLEYATKAGCISNEPVKNVDPKSRVIKDLKREVKRLKIDLVVAEKHIELLTEISTMGRSDQLAKLKEAEGVVTKSGHIQRIRALRTTLEETRPASGSSRRFSASPMNRAPESTKLAESLKLVKELRQENASLKQTLSKKNQSTNISSNEYSEVLNENRKLQEKIEFLERKIRRLEARKDQSSNIYLEKFVEPKKISISSTRAKTRHRKPPARSKEDFFMYSERKVSVTQVPPEHSQTLQSLRPPSQEFPQSKEDAIKALSEMLLARARNKQSK